MDEPSQVTSPSPGVFLRHLSTVTPGLGAVLALPPICSAPCVVWAPGLDSGSFHGHEWGAACDGPRLGFGSLCPVPSQGTMTMVFALITRPCVLFC